MSWAIKRINDRFVSCGGYLFSTTFNKDGNLNDDHKVYASHLLVSPNDQDIFVLKEGTYKYHNEVLNSIEDEVNEYLTYCLEKGRVPISNKTLYLMVGLPCSGKTSWLKSDEGLETLNMPFDLFDKPIDLNINHEVPNYVSADCIKESINGYDCKNAHLVHEESINIARDIIFHLIECSCPYIIMDGGGINKSYTKNIAEKASSNGYKVVFVIVDTPAKECARRLELRERKVPLDDLYHKNILMHGCISQYKKLAEENPDRYEIIEVNWFTNKYVYLDIDGTLCMYVKPQRDFEGDVDFVNSDIFVDPKPIKKTFEWIEDWLKKNPIENLYILGACPNSIALERKKAWIKRYFPDFRIENFCWVGNKDYKHVFLRQTIKKNKWNSRDVTMIDDYGPVLDSMEKIGVNFIHPTGLDQIK